MTTVHIAEIIDSKGLAGLDQAERERLEVHAAECADCAGAFAAARLAESMLRARSEVSVIQPPPFFEARVLNALRERQAEKAPFWSFRRWWQASNGLVAAMILIAAVFGFLTLIAPAEEAQADMSTYYIYSTEADVLSRRPARELSREQMLEVIYGERRDQGKR